MTIVDPKAVNNLLRDYGGSDLRKIVRQAQRLLSMDQIVAPFLPQNLRSHCQTAQITATSLTLIVDSAAWLTHLRYLKPQLLEQLKSQPQCVHLKEIIFRIQPTQNAGPEKVAPPKPRKLSTDNKELLRSTASIVNDPLLKKALEKLASD